MLRFRRGQSSAGCLALATKSSKQGSVRNKLSKIYTREPEATVEDPGDVGHFLVKSDAESAMVDGGLALRVFTESKGKSKNK